MKKLNKILAALLGSAMCFSSFALAACDEQTSDGDNPATEETTTDETIVDDETQTMGGGTSDASSVEELYSAAASTLSAIYSSETGYEIAGDISVTYGGEALLDLSVLLDCLYDDGFNADLTANYNSVDDGYAYLSALLRGGDVYSLTLSSAEEITDDDIAGAVYQLTSLGTAIDYLENAIYSLTVDESGETAAASDGALTKILGNVGGTVKQTSDGYTLTVDLASAASTLVTSVNLILIYITLTQDLSQITVGDLLANETIKATADGYLDGVTGEDIYTIISYVYEFISAIDSAAVADGTGILSSLPEGTADQTAYDYIVAAVAALGYDSVTLEGLEDTIANLQTSLKEIQSVLKVLTLSYTLTYNTSKTLTGVSVLFDYDPADGTEIAASVGISITEKDVTLAAIPEEFV